MKPVFNGKCSPDENNADFLLGKEKDNKYRMKILSASPPSKKMQLDSLDRVHFLDMVDSNLSHLDKFDKKLH